MSNTDKLQTSIAYLKGVGPNRAEILGKELDIFTFADLLNFFPFRYIDKTKFYKINELLPNSSEVQLIGYISNLRTVGQKRGSRLSATFTDETGRIELVWFKGAKWIQDSIKLNTPYVIYGKISAFNGMFNMPHPEMELLSVNKASLRSALQPVYRSTEKLTNRGINNRVMQGLVQQILKEINGKFEESLSVDIIDKYRLMSKSEAMFQIHFPEDQEKLYEAQKRLKFEELFFIQLQLIRKKVLRNIKFKGFVFKEIGDHFYEFYEKHLPFELTYAQKKVLKEIRKDVGSGAQMNRLLQGDVGSGKTIVALMSMLMALDNGFQSALIAPTEILAVQHYNALKELLGKMDIRIELLT
ncbi:MAG: DEAD/DEAH box helicase, partial [Lutimonas sp.]